VPLTAHFPGPTAVMPLARDIAYIGMRVPPLPSDEERWQAYKRAAYERNFAAVSSGVQRERKGNERLNTSRAHRSKPPQDMMPRDEDSSSSGASVEKGDEQMTCPVCDDDGFIDVLDENDDPIGARDCPHLHQPGHAPFNATGILGDLSAVPVRGSNDE
jgi:hypothetical protein